jgi:hypothetical protein
VVIDVVIWAIAGRQERRSRSPDVRVRGTPEQHDAKPLAAWLYAA